MSRTVGDTDILRRLESNAAVSQSYEALMSSLRLRNGVRPLTTLLVTSARPEEGKTTVAVGLALATARTGKRTLLIDADLRRPSIHRVLGVQNAKGLSDLVVDRLRLADVVQELELGPTSVGVLSVITSGRASGRAFDAIGSAALAAALTNIAGAYDQVVIDSPPVLSVNDPLLLAGLVHGVLLVVHTGGVTEADAKQAKQRLEQAGGHVLGVVMNRFDEQLHGPGFLPYHGYYEPKGAR
jgi:capsular exopolysaccharide synthesis family protein